MPVNRLREASSECLRDIHAKLLRTSEPVAGNESTACACRQPLVGENAHVVGVRGRQRWPRDAAGPAGPAGQLAGQRRQAVDGVQQAAGAGVRLEPHHQGLACGVQVGCISQGLSCLPACPGVCMARETSSAGCGAEACCAASGSDACKPRQEAGGTRSVPPAVTKMLTVKQDALEIAGTCWLFRVCCASSAGPSVW